MTLAAIVAVVTILGAVFAFLRWALPFLRRVGHFLDDWFGESERPGFPGQPGVMERLARVEHEVTDMKDSIKTTSTEQKAMWRAIEAVAKAKPPEDAA